MSTDTPAIFTWLHQEPPLCAVRKATLQATSYVSREHHDSGTADCQETVVSVQRSGHTLGHHPNTATFTRNRSLFNGSAVMTSDRNQMPKF
jgi:hypothetical protein